jgi:hypothetical protein
VKSKIQAGIRDALQLYSDGLTTVEMRNVTGFASNSIYPAIKLMPDVYIDRWVVDKRNYTKPVWCLADSRYPTPEACPKPEKDYI